MENKDMIEIEKVKKDIERLEGEVGTLKESVKVLEQSDTNQTLQVALLQTQLEAINTATKETREDVKELLKQRTDDRYIQPLSRREKWEDWAAKLIGGAILLGFLKWLLPMIKG